MKINYLGNFFLIILFFISISCGDSKDVNGIVDDDNEEILQVGPKKYTRIEVSAIISKIGNDSLTTEEKEVITAFGEGYISSDTAVIRNLASEIFEEFNKLDNRNLKTKYYSEVKVRLKELFPKFYVYKIIKEVDAKIARQKEQMKKNQEP